MLDKFMEINSLILTLFGTGIVGSIGVLIKTTRRQLAEYDLIRNSLQKILKRNLFADCQKYLQAGEISSEEFDILTESYHAYKSIGGNGTAEKAYNAVQQMRIENLRRKDI